MSSSRFLMTLALVGLCGAGIACARDAAPDPAPQPAAEPAPEPAPEPQVSRPATAPAPAAGSAAPSATAQPATATAAEAPAREPDPFFNGFEPEGKWVIAVDGTVKAASIWTAVKAGNVLLIDSPSLPQAVVVQPRQRSVETVPRDGILTQFDGTAALAADVAPTPSGNFEVVNDTVISMNVGGRAVELREAPYQLGPKTIGQLLDSNAHYRFGSARYRPSEPIVRSLRSTSKPVILKVFFGTWCPHCSEVLPKVFSVAQALEGSSVKFEFYGLDKGEAFSADPESKKYAIRGVPTAVVLVDGKEVAKIDTGAWRIPELGIQNALINAGLR